MYQRTTSGNRMAMLTLTALAVLLFQAGIAQSALLQITTATDKTTYFPLDRISVFITATNSNDYPMALQFNSSYQAGFIVDNIFDYGEYGCYAQALTEVSIPAHGNYTWKQRIDPNDFPNYPLTLGTHTVTGYVVSNPRLLSEPVEFFVAPRSSDPPGDIVIIPEPSSLVLLLGGVAGLLTYFWRRRG